MIGAFYDLYTYNMDKTRLTDFSSHHKRHIDMSVLGMEFPCGNFGCDLLFDEESMVGRFDLKGLSKLMTMKWLRIAAHAATLSLTMLI